MVDVDTEALDVLPSQRREIAHPMIGIDELWDLLLCQAQLPHDVVLILVVRILRQGWQLWRVAVTLQLDS